MDGRTVSAHVLRPHGLDRKGKQTRWLVASCAAILMAIWCQVVWGQQPSWPRQPASQGRIVPQSGAAAAHPAPASAAGRQPVRPSAVQPGSGGPTGRPTTVTPVAPFRLTPEEQAQVDRVLQLWEQHSSQVKTFRCRFKRWVYDPVFGPPDRPKYEDLGTIRYQAPDKGLFQVEQTIRNGQAVAVEPQRAEHWVCNGKSVFEYDHAKRQVTEYPLPPELQGQAITNGPLPFLFGARAEALRRRYFLRIITPPDMRGKQVWLEAYPKFQADAANFQRAHLILTLPDMTPFALNIYSPNGKNRTAYQFYDIKTNEPTWWLGRNVFEGSVPLGWRKVVEQSTPVQAQQPTTVPRG